MHRKFFGSTRRRVAAVLLSVVALAGGSGAVALNASAAPVAAVRATPDFGPGNVVGALVAIPVGAPTVNYVDQHGVPRCLPGGPNTTFLGAVGDYPNMRYTGPNPTCQFGPGAGAGLTQAQVQSLIDAAVAKVGVGSPSAKHKVVAFNADWATNADIKQLKKCPILKLTGLSSTINGQFLDETTVSYGAETKAAPTASAPNGRYCFAVLSEGLPKYSAGQPEQWNSNVSDTTMASESDVTVLGEVAPANGVTSRTFVVSINAAATDPAAPGTIAAFSNSRSFTADFSTLVF